MLHSPNKLLIATLLLGALAAVTPFQAAPSKATSTAPTGSTNPTPAATSVTGALAEMPVTRSHFGSLLENGKDPFYPNSVRIQRKPEVTQTNPLVAVAPEVRMRSGRPFAPSDMPVDESESLK